MPRKKTRKKTGHTITTSRGVEIECMAIAVALETQEANIRESIEWPDKPTRTITDVAGSTAETTLSQKYVDSSHATEDEKEAWAEYLVNLAGAEAEFKERLEEPRMMMMAHKGIRVVDESLKDAWLQEHVLFGMTVPEPGPKRSLHFLMTEIMGNLEDDLTDILVGIYRASGADPKLLEQAEATFRLEMGETKRAKVGDDSGGPATLEQEEAAGMVS